MGNDQFARIRGKKDILTRASVLEFSGNRGYGGILHVSHGCKMER